MENRVKMINSLTGSEMWVTEDRVKEYKAAGHKMADEVTKKKPAKAVKKKTKKER